MEVFFLRNIFNNQEGYKEMNAAKPQTIDREVQISNFLKANATGVSTASIQENLGLTKSECAAVLTRMKASGHVVTNGRRGKDRWVYREKQVYPLVGSVWQLADYIGGKFNGINIAQP